MSALRVHCANHPAGSPGVSTMVRVTVPDRVDGARILPAAVEGRHVLAAHWRDGGRERPEGCHRERVSTHLTARALPPTNIRT